MNKCFACVYYLFIPRAQPVWASSRGSLPLGLDPATFLMDHNVKLNLWPEITDLFIFLSSACVYFSTPYSDTAIQHLDHHR